VFLWALINAAPMLFTMVTERRTFPKAEHIGSKYEPFLRKDRKFWTFPLALITQFVFWPRMIIGWICVSGCIIVANLVDCRRDLEKEKLSKTRRVTIQLAMAFFARMHSLMGGCVYSRVERVDVDYSKYLGKEYKKTYDGAGIHVCNHLHMYDIIHGIYLMWQGGYQASFIGKRELTHIPLLGKLVTPLDSLLVGRDNKDAKEKRDVLMEQVKARQLAAEEGTERPLTIFPEGCSTSGEYVIRFKKGAFVSLRKVKPFCMNYWSPTPINPATGGGIGFV